MEVEKVQQQQKGKSSPATVDSTEQAVPKGRKQQQQRQPKPPANIDLGLSSSSSRKRRQQKPRQQQQQQESSRIVALDGFESSEGPTEMVVGTTNTATTAANKLDCVNQQNQTDLCHQQRKTTTIQRVDQPKEPLPTNAASATNTSITTNRNTNTSTNTNANINTNTNTNITAGGKQQSINYWHYKQTGIKSRPIKLLKHPIEHIERKIILTYLLQFLFKLIAIFTGPIIVLAVYLLTVPFKLLRRSTWVLLNLPCTLDARIKTTADDRDDDTDGDEHSDYGEDGDDDDDDYGDCRQRAGHPKQSKGSARSNTVAAAGSGGHTRGSKFAKQQIHWNYCPLSYIEAYWFKERLVNNVILVFNCSSSSKSISRSKSNKSEDEEDADISIEKLRHLVKASILSKPAFRKFLSCVVAKGIPFYKSYYWHYLGLANEEEENAENDNEHNRDSVKSRKRETGNCGRISSVGEEAQSSSSKSKSSLSSSSSSPLARDRSASKSSASSLSTIEDQFSMMSNNSQNDYDAVRIALPNATSGAPVVGKRDNYHEDREAASDTDAGNKQSECKRATFKGVRLSQHIYLDKSLDDNNGASSSTDVTCASIRRHAYCLLGTGLDMSRPLWEIRLIVPKNKNDNSSKHRRSKKCYLIFRCHQSLADGRSLSKILTDHLTGDLSMDQVDCSSPLGATANKQLTTIADSPELRSSSSSPAVAVAASPTGLDNDDGQGDYDGNLRANAYDNSNNVSQQDGHTNGIGKPNKQSDASETEKEAPKKLEKLDKSVALELEAETQLKPIREKGSFIARVSKANSLRSAVFVGPLTVLLWVIWTFTRRKNNHLNKCVSVKQRQQQQLGGEEATDKEGTSKTKPAHNGSNKRLVVVGQSDFDDPRRFYMNQYSLTKFYRIKQMTRSTVSDVILCALSGALRDYLRKFNGISNPPNLNISLIVDMRQPERPTNVIPAAQQQQQSLQSDPATATATAINLQQSPQKCDLCAIDDDDDDDDDDEANECTSGNNNDRTNRKKSEPEATKANVRISSNLAPIVRPQVNCTLVNVPLPTSVEGTVPRLWELRNTMDELRTSADPWVMLGLQKILFTLLPSPWYQWIINYIALRNSSTFVSSIRGPRNMVESWCVDLLQRAIFEAQQPPRAYQPQSIGTLMGSEAKEKERFKANPFEDYIGCDDPAEAAGFSADSSACCNSGSADRSTLFAKVQRLRAKQRRKSQLKFANGLGSISAIYYCMQPPTSDIPISFNCITYHDRLYVTALSRSLLVEDSKLLIRLFFKQLNQLADTIAKRKSLVTIIRTPIPIEISCPPASPLSEGLKSFPIGENDEEPGAGVVKGQDKVTVALERDYDQQDHEQQLLEQHRLTSRAERQVASLSQPLQGQPISPVSSMSSSSPAPPPLEDPRQHAHRLQQTIGAHKDDIEANFGTVERANRCQACRQTVCACRRRKSLFSFDSKQRAVNLLSLLHPSHLVAGMRTSRSNDSQVDNAQQREQQNAIECVCGQQLLEELDEENLNAGDIGVGDAREASPSVGSRTPSDDGGRLRCLSARPCCAKCRIISRRSTLSLDAPDEHHVQQRRKHWLRNLNIYQQEPNLDYPTTSNIDKRKGAHTSTQLIVPRSDRFHSKAHSKSETDLLPVTRKAKDDHQGSKESWLMIGRRSYRKLSVFSRSAGSSHPQSTSRNSTSRAGSNNAIAASSKKRNLVDVPPIEMHRLNKRLIGDQAKRRQSVATSTGVSYIHRSVVVKDEINADVSLRYQLDTPFLGIRNRRFSTIGSAVVGNQRRSSLIPFGLMHNQSFPKLFWDDGEAHL